jgi:acetyltransferase-like isoleucine patch superfamily enzyme
MNRTNLQTIRKARIGRGTKIWKYTNLYECEIGEQCMIGAFVEIQKGVRLGDRVRIQSHSFLCTGVSVEDDVFISHGVMFINDRYPPHFEPSYWKPIIVRKKAVIGSNATILPVEIGEGALVGAGSVVTRDVAPYSVVAGNPARALRDKVDPRVTRRRLFATRWRKTQAVRAF